MAVDPAMPTAQRAVRVEWFPPDDPRFAAFGALEPGGSAGAEPVAAEARCLLAWRAGRPAARLSWQVVDDLRGTAAAVPSPATTRR